MLYIILLTKFNHACLKCSFLFLDYDYAFCPFGITCSILSIKYLFELILKNTAERGIICFKENYIGNENVNVVMSIFFDEDNTGSLN